MGINVNTYTETELQSLRRSNRSVSTQILITDNQTQVTPPEPAPAAEGSGQYFFRSYLNNVEASSSPAASNPWDDGNTTSPPSPTESTDSTETVTQNKVRVSSAKGFIKAIRSSR